jgi:DNA-binding NarL/FixJ family response regulator
MGISSQDSPHDPSGPRAAKPARNRKPDTDLTSVLVVDDHPIIREFLARVIESDARLSVAGEASEGFEALRLASELRPDAMVLDVEMPGLDGAGVMRGLRDAGLSVRVLILTGHARPKALEEVRRLRPDSLVFKNDVHAGNLCNEIVAMASGLSSSGNFTREGDYALVDTRFHLDDKERID